MSSDMPTIDHILATQGYDTAEKRVALYKKIASVVLRVPGAPIHEQKISVTAKYCNPITISLNTAVKSLCIEGPSASGKSVILKAIIDAADRFNLRVQVSSS
jgi:ABC-type protease/lipase transport system fused ATPase/permease subunit